MGIFKRAEEVLFTGKTIKDYGVIDEHRIGISKFRHSVLLTERQNKKRIIIKESVVASLGASVRYFEFDKMGVRKLKEILEDALILM
ncbi:MAG: hypothetical protein DRP80_07290 [Candidatus Omnitrophota bacterium]|nr:MAG: hypothetical protein DRP80_07290 [Candidatus Omnitrophota bacterium]